MADITALPHPPLWQENVNGRNLEIKPVTSENLNDAVNIVVQNYPGELEKVARFFASSTRAADQWTLQGRENIDKLGAYMLYIDGQPAGVIGTRALKDNPHEVSLDWQGISYMYRGLGYEKFLGHYATQQASAEGKRVITSSRDDNSEISADAPLLAQIDTATLHYSAQKLKGEQNRSAFKKKYGDADSYAADGRLVDLTDLIAKQVRNPLTESFEKLNNRLFPVETERENVFAEDGLKLYVQPDTTGKYEANERRILAVLSEDRQKVIGAIVYNIAAVPSEMRQKYGVDAVLGDTYLMTDADYRTNGIGRQLIKAATDKSSAFLSAKLGITNPQIMLMTEQNDPMNMTLEDSVKDFSGAAVGPTERQNIWGRFGQRLIRGFNYIQVSLREGLDACRGLGLHVTMPAGQTEMPSDLLHYAVKSYADLALNKQQRLIETDPDMVAMDEQIKTRSSFALNPAVKEFVARDNMLMAAQKVAALDNRGEETVGALLKHYQDKIAFFTDPYATDMTTGNDHREGVGKGPLPPASGIQPKRFTL